VAIIGSDFGAERVKALMTNHPIYLQLAPSLSGVDPGEVEAVVYSGLIDTD
jgi:hypothetical protein